MDWRIGGVYIARGQRRLRSPVTCLLLAASCATFATACGELYYDPDPPSAPDREPSFTLAYYRAYSGETLETLAEGCVAYGNDEDSAAFVEVPITLGAPYVVELRRGSKDGTVTTISQREKACAAGPDRWMTIFPDPRCVVAELEKDSVLRVELLDESGDAVSLGSGDSPTEVSGLTLRVIIVSDASGLVTLVREGPPCGACGGCTTDYFSFTTTAVN